MSHESNAEYNARILRGSVKGYRIV